MSEKRTLLQKILLGLLAAMTRAISECQSEPASGAVGRQPAAPR